MVNKGYSFIEVLISVVILSVIMLSLAEFSSDTFAVTYKHSQLLANANQSRLAIQTVGDEINRAGYIFPSGESITLSGTNFTTLTINTNNAVALLAPVNIANLTYKFKVFYIQNSSLYEFASNSNYTWSSNTLPVANNTNTYGSVTLIASNLDNTLTSLTYDMNYNNGITDSILTGSISNTTSANTYALIKGIEWNLSIDKVYEQTIDIKGLSQNVPRYF